MGFTASRPSGEASRCASQAAAGKRLPPLALPPVLSVWRRRGQKVRHIDKWTQRGKATTRSGSSEKTGRRASSAHAPGEKAFFVGGVCTGSVAPLPMLTNLVPMMERTQGEKDCVSRIQRRAASGEAVVVESPPQQDEEAVFEEGKVLDSPGTEVPSSTERVSPGGAAQDVLMFNPFKKNGRLKGGGGAEGGGEGEVYVHPLGQWVEGELRSVQVSVGNPLAVQLVLDRVKVLLFGARTEVYPVTVLVPPSTSHQVTFEVRHCMHSTCLRPRPPHSRRMALSALAASGVRGVRTGHSVAA